MTAAGGEEAVMSTGERLIYMANQIARNFEAEGSERAAIRVEEHMRLYWDPHMRARIVELARRSQQLSPIAAAAVSRIGAA